jgi:hypothetical protein
MLNCNLLVFDGRDNSKSRTEVGKLSILAFCEIENRSGKNQQPMNSQGIKEQVADQSGYRRSRVKDNSKEENSSGGRDARTLVPFGSDRESNHVSYNN